MSFREELLALKIPFYSCEECRKLFPEFEVEADHITPRSAGGEDDARTNGQVLRIPCHHRKTLKQSLEQKKYPPI
jgi:5-methylcytosine-specific restriction endonuclease McrA